MRVIDVGLTFSKNNVQYNGYLSEKSFKGTASAVSLSAKTFVMSDYTFQMTSGYGIVWFSSTSVATTVASFISNTFKNNVAQ